MKNLKLIVLSMLVLSFILLPSSYVDAAAKTPTTNVVAPQSIIKTHVLSWGVSVGSGSTLNIRSGPGTKYSIVGTLNNGDYIETDAKDSSGKWYRLTSEYGSGWVSKEYIYGV